MRLTLVLGGARSGKTRWALGEAQRLGGTEVTWVATAGADAGDEEMARRIARHRAERPRAWQTIEEPRDGAAALRAARHGTIVLDCLTILLSAHAASADTEEEVEVAGYRVVQELLGEAHARSGDLIVVSNEVGQGIVPAYPLGRWFRDAQGRANQAVAHQAERVVLCVAGIPLWVKGAPDGPEHPPLASLP